MRKIIWITLILLLSFAVHSQAQFTKILPFADDDSVDIQYEIRTDSLDETLIEAEIVSTDDEVLWSKKDVPLTGSIQASNLEPDLWSPNSPALYFLKMKAVADGKVLDATSIRFGFRKVEARDGQIYLNGKPLFLRGLTINPPGRGIPTEVSLTPEFAREYLQFMKDHNLNALRLQNDSQMWFDLCDEMGMMLYQGCYGAPPGGDKGRLPRSLDECLAKYKERFFENYVRHPSIIINILSNELPYGGPVAKPYEEFVRDAWKSLKQWDPNRLYIGNAGYGNGKSGDLFDFHRYWGWYYSSVLTFYSLRDLQPYNELRENKDDNPQPITMTECVGSYTMPNGRFNVIWRQLSVALGWVGYSEDLQRESLEHQAFTLKNATEIFRRLRPLNPNLAGVMPFTIPFHYWSNIENFEDMKPKPVTEAMRVAYQPVLLSWENWQNHNYAGTTIHPIAHIVNDSEDRSALAGATLKYWIEKKRSGGDATDPVDVKIETIPYFGTREMKLAVEIPEGLETGEYQLVGNIVRGDETVSRNACDLFISQPLQLHSEPTHKNLAVIDSSGKTTSALEKLGFQFRTVKTFDDLKANEVLVIGEEAWDATLSEATPALMEFVTTGGRALILRQTMENFPTNSLPVAFYFPGAERLSQDYPQRKRPYRQGSFINPVRPSHPVFAGIDREQLGFWSDYTGWDETKEGAPSVFPVTDGVVIHEQMARSKVAVLANYELDLRALALFEIFEGEGSILYSCFDLVNRIGLDPTADRLLFNLVNYTLSPDEHEVYPEAKPVIEWGKYQTENGIVAGMHSGFLEDAAQVDLFSGAVLKTGQNRESGWNTQPGRQFTTRGRRPNGYIGQFNPKDNEDIRSALLWLKVPKGVTRMMTTVENPLDEPAPFEIVVNEKVFQEGTIQPGQVIWTSPLPGSSRDISLRYTGNMNLIVLKTEFK